MSSTVTLSRSKTPSNMFWRCRGKSVPESTTVLSSSMLRSPDTAAVRDLKGSTIALLIQLTEATKGEDSFSRGSRI